MKGAKELADLMLERPLTQPADVYLEVGRALARLAALDSAVPGEVAEIRTRAEARTWAVGQQVIDIETLLALVQRQAGESGILRKQQALKDADRARLTQEGDAARAEVERLKSNRSSLALENARLVNEHAATMSRADVLAEGVRVYREHWRDATAHRAESVIGWEYDNGHMVSK